MYPNGDVDCLHCGNCKFFGTHKSPCKKRIDHEKVKFAKPWFKTYDFNQYSGVICSDFEPAERCVFLCKTWQGFDYYWPRFVEQWGAPRYMSFILDGNEKIRYHVKTENFVFGKDLFVNGKLNAYERMYYVRDKKSPIGMRLITEPCNPLQSDLEV